jgi:hypothetical protein
MRGKKTTVEKTIRHRDCMGEWEALVLYEYEFVSAPDFTGWKFRGMDIKVYLDGKLIGEDDLDPDDRQNFEYLAHRERPEPYTL